MKNLQIPVRKLQVIPQVLPEPYDNPLWEKRNRAERREKNAVNSGHLVPWQRTQAARAKIICPGQDIHTWISMPSSNQGYALLPARITWVRTPIGASGNFILTDQDYKIHRKTLY